MENLFLGLSIILIIGSVISIIFKYFKLPAILAYIITGIIVAQISILTHESTTALGTLSILGDILPLFILGLEFKIFNLRSIGKAAVLTGLGRILIGTIAGVGVCLLLGFNSAESAFIAFALTFSSTIISVKLLSDQKDLTSLHGKITLGYVLVQDMFAVFVVVVLSTFINGEVPDFNTVMISLIKLFVLILATATFSQIIFPKLMSYISDSSEILFITSIAWALGLATFTRSPIIGFPLEVGGFLAGLALANTTENTQIISKIKSLRDFFLVIYLVFLGLSLNLTEIGQNLFPAIIISVFVIISTPVILMSILGLIGYKKRTSFLTGINVAQASEFSLIVLIIGKGMGIVTDNTIAIVTLVVIITFGLTSIMITNGDSLYDKLSKYLKIFEKRGNNLAIYTATRDLSNPIVLLGADRMGRSMLKTLSHMKEDILVLDYNPDIIKNLKDDGFNVIFGDIADQDILNKARIDEARVIISTIPEFEDNLILLTYLRNQLRNKEKKPLVILTAHSDSDKKELKVLGADYIIMPYKAAGKYLGKLIESGKIDELI